MGPKILAQLHKKQAYEGKSHKPDEILWVTPHVIRVSKKKCPFVEKRQ